MQVFNLLRLMRAGETVTLAEVNNDGDVYLNTFRANNVPIRYWDETIRSLWNGGEQYGLCIALERYND